MVYKLLARIKNYSNNANFAPQRGTTKWTSRSNERSYECKALSLGYREILQIL